MTATALRLSGNRLHLQHGPIDLVIGAAGEAPQVANAYRAAAAAFPAILPKLVEELAVLRSPMQSSLPILHGAVAQRMAAAVWPYREQFITPMAAVAGGVADEILAVMRRTTTLRRAYVNNGGDIALYLAPGETYTVGVVGNLAAPGIEACISIGAGDGIAGIATSGWRGRSQSLGIADSVTVLAATAAHADAAATMIANAVNTDDVAITRRPACEVKDDSDLGRLPVTTGVAELSFKARTAALAGGVARAHEILRQKLIVAAYIQLQGDSRVVTEQYRTLHAA